VFDNLCNSTTEPLEKVAKIAQKDPIFIQGDINNINALRHVFEEYNIFGVLHFAGLKSVGESVKEPMMYYRTNVNGTLNLLQVMHEYHVHNIVFSSSATVYGEPKQEKITEDHSLSPINPYGSSKSFAETLLRDVCRSNPHFNATLLRYFNPVGNHPSGMFGENPSGIPNNLMPVLLRVLNGSMNHVNVFGNDYDTVDGTGVRDFIHVVDLAKGHVVALKKMLQNPQGCRIYNMGTGTGYSVMEMIKSLERASNKVIPFKIVPRRPGDAGQVIADPSLAQVELGWKTHYNLEDMCEHAWKYQSMHHKKEVQ
jgi:UDP-glucose 4-epimerase